MYKDTSYLELCGPFKSGEQNYSCNFGKGHYEGYFCEIILNLDQWFRRCRLKIFLIWSSGRPFCLAERDHLCNLSRGYCDEQFCEIILNLNQWFRRYTFLIWSSGLALLFSGAELFMQF